MKIEITNNLVYGLFFWAGSIMALTGIINYFDWHFPIYSIMGMGFMIGSFTPKFFGSD